MFAQSSESYDLKLDQACIFLRAASPSCINGTFHINILQHRSFKGIRVQLLSVLKCPGEDFLFQSDRERVTSISERTIGSSKGLPSFQLPAGHYAFPFSIPLSGRMIETVTCQRQMYHTYRVVAIIERRFRANYTISRPVRIYNHPDLLVDHQLISTPVAVERQAEKGIQYCISLPDSRIPVASQFPVKCDFFPLSKNLKLRSVSVSVSETLRLQRDATASESAMHNVFTIRTSSTSTIFQSEHDYTGQTLEALATEDDNPPPKWCLSLPVQLPDTFDIASQSISTRPIEITHELMVQAKFHNTETCTPVMVKEKIPFTIYMTPAVIHDDGTIRGKDIESFMKYKYAPPAYGDHKCDAIPRDWAEYLRESNLLGQQQYCQQGIDGGPCTHIGQGSLGDEPPAYQFCST